MSELGSILTAFREKHGISQAGMAKALSVPRSTLWRWETGRGMPSYDNLKQLERYMDQKEKELGD